MLLVYRPEGRGPINHNIPDWCDNYSQLLYRWFNNRYNHPDIGTRYSHLVVLWQIYSATINIATT